MAIWRGVGGSGESTNDSTVPTVTALLVDAEAARDAAQLAETNAETAASNAASSASTASTQASNAATSATNAASSASSASTSATNAASSASTASTQASNAASSASAASTSASNAASSASSAASSASTATTKASEAATSATNAASSATAAASSASSAATQASNAASSASAASTSASNAATSESNAASSASAAAASYDSFDDRYLGAKSSAPTLDNDGNALLTGALYFNTSTNEMKVWSGSAWLNAYASLSGALLATNNLSDLNNVATARTNLGLGTAATQNSTAFATAAQGTNADTAYGWGNHALAGYAADSAVVKLTGDQTIAGTKTFSSNPILSAGTANGVVYLNGSKVATSGSALTFDGTYATIGTSGTTYSVGGVTAKLSISGSIRATGNIGVDSGVYINAPSAVSMAFVTNDAEQMRLTSTGLGIGTSSPSYKLSVNTGVAGVLANFTDGVAQTIRLTTGSGFAAIDNPSAGALAFQIAGTERMRLDSSGNLGLGVTPSASNLATIQSDYGIIVGNTGINIAQNAYYNSGWKYISSAVATRYAQSGGIHYWYNAPSGTAGNTISFTQAMTLDASGNLGLGTTSPTARLTVSTNTSNEGEIRISDNATYYAGLRRVNATDEFRIGSYGASQNITFYTVSSERARIDSSGNLIAGATSSTYSAANRVCIEVNGTTDSLFAVRTGGTARAYLQGTSTQVNLYTSSAIPLTLGTDNNERARIDSSGQMIIGATDVGRGDKLTVVGAGTLSTVTSSVRGLLAVESNSSTAQNVGGAISLGGNYDAGRTQFAAIGGYKESATSSDYAGYLAFFTRPSGDLTKERARIDSSGNLLVGQTTLTNAEKVGITFNGNTQTGLTINDSAGVSVNVQIFRNAGTAVGTISKTTTSTSYNTSSDYRLKENIQPMQNALGVVAQLNPVTYNWKADGSAGQGFIAHELAEVVPDCVTGEKDAVDADGNPIYQGIDTSFLVATLTAAIQELKAEVDSLKAQLNKGA